jgi:hypothetical protein
MKNLFFIALAGVMMFSCRQPDPNTTNGETKNVSVTIRKEVMSRTALGDRVNEGDITALKGGTLFFFNADGDAVHTYNLTAADITAEMCTVSVPATSASVAMIANNAGTALASAAPADFEAFKLLAYGIDDQAKMSAATGGTARYPAAVQDIALLDGLNSSAANGLTSAGENTYTATIVLTPAVARIEIAQGAIKVKVDNATNLTDFTFNGLYINNYAAEYTLGLTQVVPLFGVGLLGGGSDDWAAEYLALTPSQYLWDESAAAVNTADGTGGFAYHVFPGTVPDIIIRSSQFAYSEGTGDIPDSRYWLIDKYWDADGLPTDEGFVAGKGTPISTFEGGTVYKIGSILVGDTVPGDDPYDPEVTVEVSLTIVAWKEANVFVEPE